ncbi:LysR family transcriptional regulator [Azohydromonas aeria]|uniref:LysR family transcriptional regulator n=1 Tax=Azohydromonas aeria TaxID=2590212 RepID=UPI0012FACF1B|nr:LysR family transcriptional regulator [Azohydromonas aeria]
MPKLTLEGLELLDAIDRRGSFSAAGDELHKVPSTISYTVAKLEEELQVALFRRNGPRIEITPAGRELLREGRLLLQAAADLECRVQRVASGWESTLQIALDGLLPTETLAGDVAAFHEAADATRLRFLEEALTGTWESLLDGRSDLILAVGPGPAGGGYLARELAKVEFWFCVAPFHPLAKLEEPLSEAQVRAHRAVAVADSARRLPVRSAGLLSGQRTLTVPNLRVKVRLQCEGVGVGYLPRICAQGALDAGVLVRKRVEREREPETLSLAWRVGTPGRALAWWIERFSDAPAVEGLLASARRFYAAGFAVPGR